MEDMVDRDFRPHENFVSVITVLNFTVVKWMDLFV